MSYISLQFFYLSSFYSLWRHLWKRKDSTPLHLQVEERVCCRSFIIPSLADKTLLGDGKHGTNRAVSDLNAGRHRHLVHNIHISANVKAFISASTIAVPHPLIGSIPFKPLENFEIATLSS